MLAAGCALIAQATELVGDPQIRHRGTFGGSLAHADPASDLGAVVLALDAELVARGPDGERTIPATEFFTGPLHERARGRSELLTEVRVPVIERGVYLKYQRSARDWATVGVAAAEVGGRIQVALASMGPTSLRASAVEEALAGGASPADAAARAAEGSRATVGRERQQRVSGPPRTGARAARARAALAAEGSNS